MPDLVIHPARRPLIGSVPVPGDKSIAHRAILFASLASGVSRVTGGSLGDDNLSTLAAFKAMGVGVAEEEGTLLITGKGLDGLQAPSAPLDCGNSGTTMRLLAGVLAAQRFATELVGDASLTRRPMARVAAPLRLRGARIEGQIDPRRPGEITAPLRIGPLPAPHVLGPLEYELPVASAQVKSALLLSGLWADGPTYVREPLVSRDHTERMLAALGVPVRSMGAMVELDPAAWSGVLPAFTVHVPGISRRPPSWWSRRSSCRGAGWTCAAWGSTRRGRASSRSSATWAAPSRPRAAATSWASPWPICTPRTPRCGASAPAARWSRAPSTRSPSSARSPPAPPAAPRSCDAAELRVKESDRIATMARVLAAFGVSVEERPDGLVIEGIPDRPLRAATVASRGDHRVAMTAAVLGLVADGPTRVTDAGCIGTSFPRFVGTLRALGAEVTVIDDEGKNGEGAA